MFCHRLLVSTVYPCRDKRLGLDDCAEGSRGRGGSLLTLHPERVVVSKDKGTLRDRAKTTPRPVPGSSTSRRDSRVSGSQWGRGPDPQVPPATLCLQKSL